jgi:sporulation protein YlmC with PRC-barrel domain
METPSTHTLIRLSDTHLTVLDPAQDVRGRKVIDTNGQDLGVVDDLIIDDTDKHVRFLRVADGGFLGIGGQKFLIPVDALIRVTRDAVQIDRTRDHVAAGPAYDPELMGRSNLEQLYGYYGLTPFWGVGYMYPTFPFYF